jgi:DNA invertase Pin-like site-specific DNA recombinase
MLIGYARVSTDDQNLDLQRAALSEVGCTRIYEEKLSGAISVVRSNCDALLLTCTGW